MARLAEQRGLLIAGDPCDRQRDAIDDCLCADAGRVDDARQQGTRDVEEAQQIVVPVAGVDVEEQRAARVRRVGDVRAAFGEVPDEPRVDGAEGELAAGRARAGAGHVIEQPLELGAGEIGVDDEARLRRDGSGVSRGLELVALRRGTAVLPDDRVRDRPS